MGLEIRVIFLENRNFMNSAVKALYLTAKRITEIVCFLITCARAIITHSSIHYRRRLILAFDVVYTFHIFRH